MRAIIFVLSAVLIMSFVTLATADAVGSCTCMCQVGQNSRNSTFSQVLDLGDIEVESCKQCVTTFCLDSYPTACQGSMYAVCDFDSGAFSATSTIGFALVAVLGLIFLH